MPLKKDLRIIATFFAALFLITVTVNSFALAQTYTPPQIPNYNAPQNNNPNQGITIPDQPSNPGAPNTLPDNPTPTPSQPDYTSIFIAIIIVAVTVTAACIYMISRRKNSITIAN
jgi:hypothetical protein